MATSKLERQLRTALIGVLSDRLPEADRLALSIYAADQAARTLAAEVEMTPTDRKHHLEIR